MSTNAEVSKRITGHLETALALALSSMTGRNFTVTAEPGQEIGELEAPAVWRQSFSFDPEPALWLVAGKDLWSAAAQLTLSAVGIDSLTDDDCRSAWQEIVAQAVGSFSSALTTDLGQQAVRQEIVTGKGEEQSFEPAGVQWTVFSARHDEITVWYLKAAWQPSLETLYDRPEPEPKALAAGASTFSRTFDLLLDVALPVSVSFGKTRLQIRDVLKLNTGSIVELNRLVTEPVEVIVNDCVIARGEVVVVDGNYGVRVTHLASREDRLRSGATETSARSAASAGRE